MISGENMEPTEIETLLPWYAAGTLRRRDRQRVEDALRYDPALARHADLVREELAETISFNESLGVPSARCMDRLMAAIDAETVAARKRNSARVIAAQFSSFIAGFSPRTLAVAASFAVAAFAHEASAGEITRVLEDYQATLVDGPKPGGFYRVRLTMKTLAKEELARIVSRMRQERVVETANAGDSD